MEPQNQSLQTWFQNLTRNQAGAVGCAAGFVLGMIAGPIFRLILTIGIIIAFGFLARHLEKKFESRLGIYGVIVAILTCTTLGPLQKWFGSALGEILNQTSRFALAILGTYFVLRLHDQSKNSTSE